VSECTWRFFSQFPKGRCATKLYTLPKPLCFPCSHPVCSTKSLSLSISLQPSNFALLSHSCCPFPCSHPVSLYQVTLVVPFLAAIQFRSTKSLLLSLPCSHPVSLYQVTLVVPDSDFLALLGAAQRGALWRSDDQAAFLLEGISEFNVKDYSSAHLELSSYRCVVLNAPAKLRCGPCLGWDGFPGGPPSAKHGPLRAGSPSEPWVPE